MHHTIVAIDDERLCLQSLSLALMGSRYKVIEFTSARTALEHLKTHGTFVDLVVSDLQMPEMSCIELLSLIKSDPRLKHIPLIVQSGASFDLIETCLRLGASGYVMKPYSSQTLLRVVVDVLARSTICKNKEQLEGMEWTHSRSRAFKQVHAGGQHNHDNHLFAEHRTI